MAVEATQRHVVEHTEERVSKSTHGSPMVEIDLEDVSPPLSPTTRGTASIEINRDGWRLAFGTVGIYAAFIYYGSLQEDVFGFTNAQGEKFEFAWFLLVLEATANIVVAMVGRLIMGGTTGLPMRQFLITGASQVFSKAFTGLSLSKGLSFPVATLAKSGKMAPVMLGQLLLGGTTYSIREYLQVGAIILGTALLSFRKKKGESSSSPLGVIFILLSLVMDGVTGGVQKRLKSDMKLVGLTPKPFDFMLFTNLSMMLVAFALAIAQNEFILGWEYMFESPQILRLVIQFAICSAVGQSFIFYTVVHFDPLVCSTVTTTRKIFSVLISIFLKGHQLTSQGWIGVMVAIGGILSEVHCKITKTPKMRMKSKVSM